MSVSDEGKLDEVDFSWGLKKGLGGKHGDVQIYNSFTYDGVEYFLYDSVYLFKDGVPEPYIGKLIQIYERPNKERKVIVLWFFRPSEVSNFLGGENVLENELFLGTGCGRGLANINPLEAIAGKCNVMCISKDQRNRQPSTEEVRTAHFVFYRAFDIQHFTISDVLRETIATVKVNYLLNKSDFPQTSHDKLDSGNTVVRIKNSPNSVENTLVAENAVENDGIVGPLTSNDDDDGAEDILDKSKSCPPKNRGDVQCDDTCLKKGLKKNLVSNKHNVGADENVLFDAGVCSFLVKYDRVSNKKGDVPRSDNTGSADLCETKVVLGSGQKFRLRSPDSMKTEVDKVTEFAAKTGPSSSGTLLKSKLVKSVHPSDERAKNHGQKSVADFGAMVEKPSKKLNDNVAPLPSSNDKVSQSSGVAAETIDKRKMIKSVKPSGGKAINLRLKSGDDCGKCDGSASVPSSSVSEKGKKEVKMGIQIGTGLVRKLKSVNDSGALEERPSKKLKHNGMNPLPLDDGGFNAQNTASVSAANNNASEPSGIAAKTTDKSKMGKQLVGRSSVIPKMLKSNSITESKPVGKLLKLSTRQPVGDAAEISDSRQLDRGISHGLPKKPKYNNTMKEKSSDKVSKTGAMLSKDMRKSTLASCTSDKAPQCNKVESGCGVGLDGTKDGLTHLKSKGKVEDKSNLKLNRASIKQAKVMGAYAYGHLIEVTQRPPPWEERMKEARDRGSLVLLLNLDPTYTSHEVEFKFVFMSMSSMLKSKSVVTTNIFFNVSKGQAYAIFKTPEAAKKIVRKLDEECLILPNGRTFLPGSEVDTLFIDLGEEAFSSTSWALVGVFKVLSFSGKKSSYPGHLRDAVSTSHTSQPNNLEYEIGTRLANATREIKHVVENIV
uniref:BAH domain-containing protein n=1 Tax=Chenopodium quinoa TaxID=63459 RepID=A0A803L5K5_CHEQI